MSKKKLPGRLDKMMSSLRHSMDDSVLSGSDSVSGQMAQHLEKLMHVSGENFEAIVDRFTSLEEVSEAIRSEGVDECGLIIGMTSFEQDDTVEFGSDDADLNEKFVAISNRFSSLSEVSESIKRSGVENCGLIFGIDYTLSNKVQGKSTYDGFSLHDVTQKKANPYQQIICILGETLEPFDDDGIIPAFGFGDHVTKDKGIFPLKPEGDCDGFSEVLDVYNERTPKIHLGGPTNFAPLIEKAVEIVKETKQYHILVIVADGQVTSETATVNAIVKASNYPLSIVVIGVGDGPWDVMETFDDKLPERKFDNFQFVNFHEVSSKARNPQAAVALAALMEIPDQYNAIKRLGLLERL